ncbi:MAG: hypothetical protein AAF694_15640 [Bacteroidota bacterium]
MKIYKRRGFKIIASIFLLLFTGLFAVDMYVRNLLIPVCDTNETSNVAIKCPFLAIAKPSTKNRAAFLRDVNKAGMSRTMAMGAAIQVGVGQNGIWATLFGKAPDMYNLEDVHGISHCDRYNRYLPEVEQMLKEREIDNQVTLQDLVEVKEWIAKKERVEINSASRQETALLFGYAGGNLRTKRVFTEDVILLMNGSVPTRGGTMDVTLFQKVQELAVWK